MASLVQSGESPVRQLADLLTLEQVAEQNRLLSEAVIAFAVSIIAAKRGYTAGELLRIWSPFR